MENVLSNGYATTSNDQAAVSNMLNVNPIIIGTSYPLSETVPNSVVSNTVEFVYKDISGSANIEFPKCKQENIKTTKWLNSIKEINVLVPNKVVEVIFNDGAKTKSVCQEPDSFSFESAIAICIAKKVMGAVTDPNRIRKDDKGNPDNCMVAYYHNLFTNKEDCKKVCEECKAGARGCVAWKKQLAQNIIEFLAPMREKRKYYEERPELVDKMLIEGTEKARKTAKETMKKVKKAMRLDYFGN